MREESRRITLIISSLTSGGAERVMSIMANYWAEKGWVITLITISSEEQDFYKIHPHVNRIALNLLGKSTNYMEFIRNNSKRIMCLRRAIRESRPEIVISFLDRTNILTLLASLGLRIPIIVSERINPLAGETGNLFNLLRKRLYRFAKGVIVQTSEVQNWAKQFLSEKQINIIPNPVRVLEKGNLEIDVPFTSKHKAVAMGRLVPQKGFDLLIRAFSTCVATHPNWSLYIIGEGPERKHLEALIEELELGQKVFLIGRHPQPEQILFRADIFVLSSRYEGFPNALLEAMSCGLPVISTDCPSGPREIIKHGVDGLLVPNKDIESLAKAMNDLMSDESLRKNLATQALEVQKRFSLEKIMDDWEKLIGAVLKSLKSNG